MLTVLLILIFTRPLISSLAFPCANAVHVTLMLGFILFWIARKGLAVNAIKPMYFPLFLFIAAISVSTVFAQDKISAFQELYQYAQGILLFIIAASLSPIEKNRVIVWLLASAFVISLLAIYQYFFGFRHLLGFVAERRITDTFILDYIGRGRPFLPFVTPNTLAGYLAMMLPLTFVRKNIIWLIVPLSIALLLTKSLGALASLFLGLCLFLYFKKWPKKINIILLSSLLLILGFVLFARLGISQSHTHPLFSATMRLNYWGETLSVIKTHALIGLGPGNFNLTHARYTHNSYIQMWAEMGILGIVSFLWLAVIILFKNGVKNPVLVTACAIFLTHNFVDFTFFLPEVSLIWWVMLGLTFVQGSCLSSDKHLLEK